MRRGRSIAGVALLGLGLAAAQTACQATWKPQPAEGVRTAPGSLEFVGKNRRVENNPEDFTTDFKGLEVTLQRRFSNRWQGLVTYALSSDNLSSAAVTVAQYGGEEEGAGQHG